MSVNTDARRRAPQALRGAGYLCVRAHEQQTS